MWPFGRRAKQGAVQSAASTSTSYRQSLAQSWQARARFFAEACGLVSFAQETASLSGSRVDWTVQQRQADGTWQTVEDDGLTGVLSWYSNDWQTARDLFQAHLYRIGVDGERYEIMVPRGNGAAGFYVVPQNLVLWQGEAGARVMLSPNGRESDGTMLMVDGERIKRQWVPGKEYPLLAWSPMKGVQEDLERYWSLIRYVRRTADSRLAMNKILVTSAEIHTVLPPDHPGRRGNVTDPKTDIDVAFEQAGAMSTDDDSIQSLLPFMLRQPDKFKPPTLIDMARGMDPALLTQIDAAANAVAVGLPLPASLILGKDANHWNEWLMDERSFRWAIAPNVERVASDVTMSFLRPTLGILAAQGQFRGDPADFRVWYDPTPVLVHPDQTAHALELHLAGLLAAIPTLEAYGFEAEDMMNAVERADVAAFIQAKSVKTSVREDTQPPAPTMIPSGTSAGGVSQGPPALAAVMPGAIEAEMRAWYTR